MKIELTSDTFGITERLKAIEKDYFVVYDTVTLRYEVHSRANKGNTFCLAVPYRNLDARTVTLVNMTRVERTDKLIKEIERYNAAL